MAVGGRGGGGADVGKGCATVGCSVGKRGDRQRWIGPDRSGHDRSIHDMEAWISKHLTAIVDHAGRVGSTHRTASEGMHRDDAIEQPQRRVHHLRVEHVRDAVQGVFDPPEVGS